MPAPVDRRTDVHRLRLLGERAWGTLLGADPGLVRLRSAGRTTLALAVVLAVLALLAGVTGQPTSGVLVGALVAMAPAMTPPDPDPHHRRTTTAALVVLAAAVALAAGVLLAPHRLAADLGLCWSPPRRSTPGGSDPVARRSARQGCWRTPRS